MKLEDLTPPVELCKLIPAGEFEDSVFIWDNTEQYGFWDGEDKNGNHIGGWGKLPSMGWRVRNNFSERCRKLMKETGVTVDCYPAPTVAEIMEKIHHCRLKHKDNIFFFDLINKRDIYAGGYNPAEIALQVWLKIKGIEA